MRKSNFILLPVTVLLIASLACAAPGFPAPTEDLSSLGTAIMQTMISAATQTSAVVVPIDLGPTATFTPELPTLTPTETLTPTPIFTATPITPQISVSVNTNCRVGPGKVYDRVGALMVGEVAEVAGRDLAGRYWLIRNPDQSNGYCWLWGEYATLTGNLAVLPVYTPPPTPTPMPDFEASFRGIDSCSNWWIDIGFKNTGGLTFRSISMTVRDRDTDIAVSMYADKFTNLDGCSSSSTEETMGPGENSSASSAAFTYDPTGHDLRATITLCSAAGQNGTCVTEVIDFEP